ncbi:hypothetical protein [Rhodopirellula sp. SWK7]|uniref:hypothetical protein n=1 Tax=Rhodopirellula sp. SWK7 TaxID=595460 RepID=UPI0002BE7DA9|nr:hypothetical protein [Rhodopirellula sp. SWK7]EMI43482.1 hypothetical protein RRSWK_04003 [Rhodopirellula sp. SWK7]
MNAPLKQIAALRKSSEPQDGDNTQSASQAGTPKAETQEGVASAAEMPATESLSAEASNVGESGPEAPSIGGARERVDVVPAEPLVPAEQLLESLEQELNRIQRSMRLTLQAKLQALVGRSLGSLEHNRALAASIQAMLDQHGFRLRCQQCGHPAILRVSPRKGVPSGAFVLDHTIDGKRTFHGGGAIVPPIHLLAKPQRKRRVG